MRVMLCCLLLVVLAGCQADPAAAPAVPSASAPAVENNKQQAAEKAS